VVTPRTWWVLVGVDGADRGQSSLRHDHAHSQVSAHVLPAQFRQPLLTVDTLRGSLFNTRHSRSHMRLLATYLLTYRAPGRRIKAILTQKIKATYLLFGTSGIELRSSKRKTKRCTGKQTNGGKQRCTRTIMIRDQGNPASRGTETSAEVLVGPPGRTDAWRVERRPVHSSGNHK
jgi:hypothetical protein